MMARDVAKPGNLGLPCTAQVRAWLPRHCRPVGLDCWEAKMALWTHLLCWRNVGIGLEVCQSLKCSLKTSFFDQTLRVWAALRSGVHGTLSELCWGRSDVCVRTLKIPALLIVSCAGICPKQSRQGFGSLPREVSGHLSKSTRCSEDVSSAVGCRSHGVGFAVHGSISSRMLLLSLALLWAACWAEGRAVSDAELSLGSGWQHLAKQDAVPCSSPLLLEPSWWSLSSVIWTQLKPFPCCTWGSEGGYQLFVLRILTRVSVFVCYSCCFMWCEYPLLSIFVQWC